MLLMRLIIVDFKLTMVAYSIRVNSYTFSIIILLFSLMIESIVLGGSAYSLILEAYSAYWQTATEL